jgi:hypothetical protein
MRFGRIVERLHEWMSFEGLLHDAALDALAPPVNQSDFA